MGEVAWSEDSLAERWKWSRGKVRRYLKELETVQQIVHHKKYTVSRIKIVNYLEYQRNGTTSSTTDGTTDGTNDNNGNNGNKHLGDESPIDMGWNKKSDNDDELPAIDMDTREPERDLEDERKKKVTALIEWAEKVRGKKFLDTPTQRKFINDMRTAGISPTDIKQTYQELLVSEYWTAKETLPDFKTVFSNLKNKV